MAVRLASDTIRTLYAIQCITRDVKQQPLAAVYKNEPEVAGKVYAKSRQMSTKRSPTDTLRYDPTPVETIKQRELQNPVPSSESALVHKVHLDDRSLGNDVPEREKCKELDEILAKWNVHKPRN